VAGETATALAVRKEEAVEVVDAKPCSDLLALMADAKAAEKLVPWTDEEIGKASLAELGERVRLVCSHFKLALISEHDFVMRFKKEFQALRENSRDQGRRLPIPACPTWTEVKKAYFKLSSRQVDRLLADPDKPKAERKRKRRTEKPVVCGDENENLDAPDTFVKEPAADGFVNASTTSAVEEAHYQDSLKPLKESWDTVITTICCRPRAMVSFFRTLEREEQEDILIAISQVLAPVEKAISNLKERYAEAFPDDLAPVASDKREDAPPVVTDEEAGEHEESEEIEKQLCAQHPEWRQPGEPDEQWAARRKEMEKKAREEKKKTRSEASRKAAATRKAQRIPIVLLDGRHGHVVKGGGRKSKSLKCTVEFPDRTTIQEPTEPYCSWAANLDGDLLVPEEWLIDSEYPEERIDDFVRPHVAKTD
jgi:hypothetical protein